MPNQSKTTVIPELGTAATAAFLDASRQDFALFHFLIDTVLVGDYVVHVAEHGLNAIDNQPSDPRISDPTTLAQKKPGSRTRFLREKRQAFLEMFLGRAVDNFQKYIVELLHQVLRKQPLILASRGATIQLEQVLKSSSMEEFVGDLIQRKVTSLSYRGFRELQDWCSAKGIPLVVPPAIEPILIEIIATRNLIAHNRCMIDRKYLQAVPTSQLKPGAVRVIEPDDLFKAQEVLLEVVLETDKAAIAKFALEQVGLRKNVPVADENADNNTSASSTSA